MAAPKRKSISIFEKLTSAMQTCTTGKTDESTRSSDIVEASSTVDPEVEAKRLEDERAAEAKQEEWNKAMEAERIAMAEKKAEEERLKAEAEERQAKALEAFKAGLKSGFDVKKFHQKKKGSASRVVWADDALTCLYVAAKKTSKADTVKKYTIAEITSLTSLNLNIMLQTGDLVLEAEFPTAQGSGDFVQYITMIRDQTFEKVE